MTQITYEIRPMKDERVVMSFPDREQALKWARKRKVPVRLVMVETLIVNVTEIV